MRNKLIISIGVIILFIMGIISLSRLENRTMPSLTTTEVSIMVDWNDQISLEENEHRMKNLISYIDTEPSYYTSGELQYLLTYDPQKISESKLIVKVEPNAQDNLRRKVATFFKEKHPRSTHLVQPKKNTVSFIFDNNDMPLFAKFYNNKNADIPQPQEIESINDDLRKNNLSVTPPNIESILLLKIHSEHLLIYGIPKDQIISKLKSLFDQNYITELQDGNQYIPIYLGDGNEANITQILQNQYFESKEGHSYPLYLFLTPEIKQYYKVIQADRSGEYFAQNLVGNVNENMKTVRDLIQDHQDISVKFSGSYFENAELIRKLGFILLVVVALLYLILVAQFESLVQPLIIMLLLPIGFAGSFLTLDLGSATINLVSMVGIMIMMGIVINDAILKIDIYNQSLKRGLTKMEAIYTASKKRARPIIMTSLTTIFAMLPILFLSGLGAELQRPLALSVIGGLFCSTIASLLFLPTILYILPAKTQLEVDM